MSYFRLFLVVLAVVLSRFVGHDCGIAMAAVAVASKPKAKAVKVSQQLKEAIEDAKAATAEKHGKSQTAKAIAAAEIGKGTAAATDNSIKHGVWKVAKEITEFVQGGTEAKTAADTAKSALDEVLDRKALVGKLYADWTKFEAKLTRTVGKTEIKPTIADYARQINANVPTFRGKSKDTGGYLYDKTFAFVRNAIDRGKRDAGLLKAKASVNYRQVLALVLLKGGIALGQMNAVVREITGKLDEVLVPKSEAKRNDFAKGLLSYDTSKALADVDIKMSEALTAKVKSLPSNLDYEALTQEPAPKTITAPATPAATPEAKANVKAAGKRAAKKNRAA